MKTNTNRRNIPTHPGAMTPAELHRRTLHRIAEAAAALAIVAANLVLYAYLFLNF